MSNEVFEPMRKSGIVLLVVLCFAAGIVSLVEKQWSQGIAWICCGYWEASYFKLKEKVKDSGLGVD